MTDHEQSNEEAYEVCVIQTDLREACTPKDAILEKLAECGYSEDATFGVKLALEEALCNAVKHGNKCDQSKTITVSYSITTERAAIIVRDEGGGFKPEKVPDCTAPDRVPLPNGRGIMLIRSYMDEVEYRDNGREVYFVKRRQ